jgi:serine/threonine protein kinase
MLRGLCMQRNRAAPRKAALHCARPQSPVTLLLPVCAGLEYLHARNIVHGDLKPDNVLIKKNPQYASGWTAKLTDFGFSQALGADRTHVSNFSSGTPYYVAPEVVLHHRLTTASDIYSLGVLMWEVGEGWDDVRVFGIPPARS